MSTRFDSFGKNSMKIELSLIVQANTSLSKFAQNKFPASVTWKLLRIMNIVGKEFSAYEATRLRLVNDLGEKVGEITKVKDENIEEFKKQLIELTSNTVELNLPKLSIDELGSFEMSVEDIAQISFIFVEYEALRKDTLKEPEEAPIAPTTPSA